MPGFCTPNLKAPTPSFSNSSFPLAPYPLAKCRSQRLISATMSCVNSLAEPEKIRRDGSSLDRFSFPPLLKAVSKASALTEGLEIHGLATKSGFDSDPFIQTALISMYVSCGRIMEARLLFDKMSPRDVVTWTIMLDGYSQIGLFDQVLKLYEEMKSSVKCKRRELYLIRSQC